MRRIVMTLTSLVLLLHMSVAIAVNGQSNYSDSRVQVEPKLSTSNSSTTLSSIIEEVKPNRSAQSRSDNVDIDIDSDESASSFALASATSDGNDNRDGPHDDQVRYNDRNGRGHGRNHDIVDSEAPNSGQRAYSRSRSRPRDYHEMDNQRSDIDRHQHSQKSDPSDDHYQRDSHVYLSSRLQDHDSRDSRGDRGDRGDEERDNYNNDNNNHDEPSDYRGSNQEFGFDFGSMFEPMLDMFNRMPGYPRGMNNFIRSSLFSSSDGPDHPDGNRPGSVFASSSVSSNRRSDGTVRSFGNIVSNGRSRGFSSETTSDGRTRTRWFGDHDDNDRDSDDRRPN